jgi:hypothetical protein
MAAYAIPLCLTRVCDKCALDYPGTCCLITKSKAKQACLLSDKDLASLPSAVLKTILLQGEIDMTLFLWKMSRISLLPNGVVRTGS